MTPDKNNQPGHYYVREPAVRSQPRELRARLAGHDLVLTTDRGVFSHGKLDRGTKLLAETVEIPAGARVLDLGCGYGVLGIVAALEEPTCCVTMTDVNSRACSLAKRNAQANGAGCIEVINGDAREVLAGRDFDLILINPPLRSGRENVLRLFRWCASTLAPGGELWCVIQTNKGARRYARDLEQWFGFIETVRISGGYRIFRAREPRQDEQPG